MSPLDSTTTSFSTGAVRSADSNKLEFTSMPWIGLIGVARTAQEGASKYGRYNYMLGMPVHDLLNHVIAHIGMDILGDRSEPNLEHAAWGLLAAIQSRALNPELSAPHSLGAGATLTHANREYLAEQAPTLQAKREAGECDPGNWSISDIPQIRKLIAQRSCIAWPRETTDLSRQLLDSDRIGPTPDDVRHKERCRQFDEAIQREAFFDPGDGDGLHEPEGLTNTGYRQGAIVEVTIGGDRRKVWGCVYQFGNVCQDQGNWEKTLLLDTPERIYALASTAYHPHRTVVVTKSDWDASLRGFKTDFSDHMGGCPPLP